MSLADTRPSDAAMILGWLHGSVIYCRVLTAAARHKGACHSLGLTGRSTDPFCEFYSVTLAWPVQPVGRGGAEVSNTDSLELHAILVSLLRPACLELVL